MNSPWIIQSSNVRRNANIASTFVSDKYLMETYRLRYDPSIKAFVNNRNGVLRHAIDYAKDLNKITTDRKAPVDKKEAALFLWALAMGKYGHQEMAIFFDDVERRVWRNIINEDDTFLIYWCDVLKFGPIEINRIEFNKTAQSIEVFNDDGSSSFYINTKYKKSSYGSDLFVLDRNQMATLHSAIVTNHINADEMPNPYEALNTAKQKHYTNE